MKKFVTQTDAVRFRSISEEYLEAVEPFYDRMTEINRRYDFGHGERSEEDERVWQHAAQMIEQTRAEFVKRYPPKPCPGCAEMVDQIFGICTNYGDCKLALPIGG